MDPKQQFLASRAKQCRWWYVTMLLWYQTMLLILTLKPVVDGGVKMLFLTIAATNNIADCRRKKTKTS